MVRLTVDLINDSYQFINAVRDRELSLRNCKIPLLENLGVTRDQFDTIDLTDNDIRKLENIPLLKRLRTLLMHNNRVQHIMPNIGEVLPSLKTLALTNNNLCELGDIDPLAQCKNLEYLTLIGNPISHKPQYRSYVIYKIPSVRVLDFKRVRLVEKKLANKLFKGKKGKKLQEEIVKRTKAIADDVAASLASNKLKSDDAKKIQEAIESVSSIAEAEFLQTILQSGRIPDSNWKKAVKPIDSTNLNEEEKNENKENFEVETEENEVEDNDEENDDNNSEEEEGNDAIDADGEHEDEKMEESDKEEENEAEVAMEE